MNGNTRSPDFRYIYSNGTKVQFGPNEVIFVFGFKEDATAADDIIREEVGVVLSPVAAKLLAITLMKTINHVETVSGSVIPVDNSKLEQLERMIQSAKPQPT